MNLLFFSSFIHSASDIPSSVVLLCKYDIFRCKPELETVEFDRHFIVNESPHSPRKCVQYDAANIAGSTMLDLQK